MNIEAIFLYAILAGLIIWREVWHVHVENKLHDRLMARNFTELARVEKYRAQTPPPKVETASEDPNFDDYAAAQTAKANLQFGVRES